MSNVATQVNRPKSCKLQVANIINEKVNSLLSYAGYIKTGWIYRVEARVKMRGNDREYSVSPPSHLAIPLVVRAKGNDECWRLQLTPPAGLGKPADIYQKLKESIGYLSKPAENKAPAVATAKKTAQPAPAPSEPSKPAEAVKTDRSKTVKEGPKKLQKRLIKEMEPITNNGIFKDNEILALLMQVVAEEINTNKVNCLGRTYFADIVRKELGLKKTQTIAGYSRSLLTGDMVYGVGKGPGRCYMLSRKAWDLSGLKPHSEAAVYTGGHEPSRDSKNPVAASKASEPSAVAAVQEPEDLDDDLPDDLADQVAGKLAKIEYYQKVVQGKTPESAELVKLENEWKRLETVATKAEDEYNRLTKRLASLKEEAEVAKAKAAKVKAEWQADYQKHGSKITEAKRNLKKLLGIQ